MMNIFDEVDRMNKAYMLVHGIKSTATETFMAEYRRLIWPEAHHINIWEALEDMAGDMTTHCDEWEHIEACSKAIAALAKGMQQ